MVEGMEEDDLNERRLTKAEFLSMNATKRCELCDTVLEFEQGGQRFRFTAHKLELCLAATKQRIAELKQALVDQRENYARALRDVVRSADKVLADAGLQTLTHRGKQSEALALAELWKQGHGGGGGTGAVLAIHPDTCRCMLCCSEKFKTIDPARFGKEIEQ